MSANPAAQPLNELIASHGLSIRAVADAAGITESIIRKFRDILGRTPNKAARIAIAQALHILTQEVVDLVSLFSVNGDAAYQCEVNVDRNPKLSDLLRVRRLTPRRLARESRVKIDTIVRLLKNTAIDPGSVQKLADYLGVSSADIGVVSSNGELLDFDALGREVTLTLEQQAEAVEYDEWRQKQWDEAIAADPVLRSELEWEAAQDEAREEYFSQIEAAQEAAHRWFVDLIDTMKKSDRIVLMRFLSEPIPVMYLNEGQYGLLEVAFRYLRTGRLSKNSE